MPDTERILYFDCFSGISGDMTLAAFADLGLPEEHLQSELAKLKLPGWRLRFSPGEKHGIHGTRADVDLLAVPLERDLSPLKPRNGEAGHRAYRDIKALIGGSLLSQGTKDRALSIFRLLADAEATVHGTKADEVVFHEVGAVDSIVDIVGAAIGLEYFSPDRILASSVELGGGFVNCRHGLIPVPAPAVVELLRGVPIKSGAVPFETTTPTGAAILASCVDEFTDDKRFSISKTAYGVGHRDTDIPNLLRLFLGTASKPQAESLTASSAEGPQLPSLPGVVIECNIDDMSPELHGYLFDRLFAAGAQDVWLTPIVMKKSRPGITLSVLCPLELEGRLAALVFRETTTLGFRRYPVDKVSLERIIETVETSLGAVRVKTAYLEGRAIKAKPEYEDLRRIAESGGLPLREVQERVLRELGAEPGEAR